MEVIALIISIISILLTIGQLIYGAWKNRTNIRISIQHLETSARIDETWYIFAFMINNLSSAPISITGMEINGISCCLLHQWTGARHYPASVGNGESAREIMFSADFPINLIPHSGTLVKVVFIFRDPAHIPSNLVTIHVKTDKKEKTFTLYMPEADHDAVHF